VLHGGGVLTYDKPAPNFAGHYVVIVWGCGAQCVMMAIVDVKTGIVYDPPLSGAIRDACRNFRKECGTYYFNWRDNQFRLIKLVESK